MSVIFALKVKRLVGVEEEDSGASMLPASGILKNSCFERFSGMEYILK